MKKKNLIIICASVVAVVVAAVIIVVLALGKDKGHDCEFTNYVSNGEVSCTVDKTSTAKCNHDGCDKTDTRVDKEASVHDYEVVTHIAAGCETKEHFTYKCKNCPDTYEQDGSDALGHIYVVYAHTEVGCETDEATVYKCSGCDDSYEVVSKKATGHSIFAWTVSGEPTLNEGTTCEYTQKYVGRCGYCAEKVEKAETVHIHDFVSKVTTEATCVASGIKTYTCSKCQESDTEEYTNALAHKWDNGTVDGAITTYACINTGCSHTKTAIVAKTEVSASVSADNLNGNEVELKNASIALDADTLSDLGSTDVTLSADTVEDTAREEVVNNLTEDQKAQLGENTIYNFSMEQDGSPVSEFGGLVKVTIPYTLDPEEDPNNIGIWYLADDGTVETLAATYANGFVTFETSHFSYYSVTRLTPKERCELYGHVNSETVINPTCTLDGYTLTVCKRCGETNKTKVVTATGHTYTSVTENATCTTNGKTTHTCSVCNYNYVQLIPAFGHAWEVTEKIEATTEAAGSIKYTCPTCNSVKETVIPKLEAAPVEITNADVIENVIEDIIGRKITVKLNNFEVKVEGMEVSMPILEGYVSLDDNLNLNGYFIVKQSMKEGIAEEIVDQRIYIYQNKVYTKSVTTEGGYVSSSDLSYQDISVSMDHSDISMEQIEAYLQMLDSWYNDSFSAIVEKLESTNSQAIKQVKEDIVNTIFDIEETLNGYVITLNLDGIEDLLTYLTTATIYDIAEKVVGEDILTNVDKVLTYSIGDLISYIESKGFVLSEVIASLDDLVKVALSDYEIESVEALLQMYTGNADLDIDALLANEDILAYKVADALIMMLGEEATYEDVKAMIEQYIEQFKTVKVLDLVMMYMGMEADDESNPILDMVNEGIDYVARVLEGVNFSITCDAEFKVKDIKFNISLTGDDLESELIPSGGMVPEMFNIEAAILLDYVSNYDLSNIKAEYDSITANIFKDDNVSSLMAIAYMRLFNEGYTVVGEGNNIKLVQDMSYENVYEQGENDATTYYTLVGKQITTSQVDMNALKSYDNMSIEAACGDWVEVYYNVNVVKTVTVQNIKRIYNTSDNSLVSEEILINDTSEEENNIYMSFYFNKETGSITQEYKSHNYVEDLSLFKEAVGCEGLGRHVYTCTECGQVRVRFYTNGHQEYMIECSFDGEEDCESGVSYTMGCKNCDWTRTGHSTYHITIEEETPISDFGGNCEGYVVHYGCPCKKEEWINIESSCDFDQDSEYDEVNDEWIYYYTCALTDPYCGFAYARTTESVYDSTNPCKRVVWTVYYFGITNKDLTTAKKVLKYEGSYEYQHNYQKDEAASSSSDSYAKSVYSCTRCDAYYSYEYYYDETGRTTKYIYTENRPEYDELTYREEVYGEIHTGRYDTDDKEYVLFEKLSEYYVKTSISTQEELYSYNTSYEYSFDGVCKRKETTYYKDDFKYNEQEWCTSHGYNESVYVDGGCSQDSKYVYRCLICHNSDTREVYVKEHSWYWDSELNTYVCDRCDLESTTGADGVIIIEDCTDYDSNPEYLKIGYYVHKELEHMVYVSIILNDAEDGENDQVVFDEITIDYADPSEGRYVLISIEEIAAAIDNSEYATRDYSIRVSFVPVNYQDDLDYSITIE